MTRREERERKRLEEEEARHRERQREYRNRQQREYRAWKKSEKANREAVSKLIKILGMLGTRHRRAALLSSVEAHRLEGSTQLTCGDRGVEQAKAPAEGSAGNTR